MNTNLQLMEMSIMIKILLFIVSISLSSELSQQDENGNYIIPARKVVTIESSVVYILNGTWDEIHEDCIAFDYDNRKVAPAATKEQQEAFESIINLITRR